MRKCIFSQRRDDQALNSAAIFATHLIPLNGSSGERKMGRALSHPPVLWERACVFQGRTRTHTFSLLVSSSQSWGMWGKAVQGSHSDSDYFMKNRRIKLGHIMHIIGWVREISCAAAAKANCLSCSPSAVCPSQPSTLYLSTMDSAEGAVCHHTLTCLLVEQF